MDVFMFRYCECFASNVLCGEKCKCRKCKNVDPNRPVAKPDNPTPIGDSDAWYLCTSTTCGMRCE